MCNEAFRNIQIARLEQDWAATAAPLAFPEGRPNVAALDSIRITDRVEIIRAGDTPGSAMMLTRRWSWPGPTGKPVFNFRSDDRQITTGRCLVPVDGFYEFGPAPAEPDLFGAAQRAKAPAKAKYSFTRPDDDWFCIAGIWRTHDAVGEAFAMLTCEPGPDVAPYHARQVVVVARADHQAWLDGSAATADICRPLPAGSLVAARVR